MPGSHGAWRGRIQKQMITNLRACLQHTHGEQIFRLGGIQLDWAHPQLEEGVVRQGVPPNQQM